MGISLKDIFKNDEEVLVENRRKNAIRNMIIFSCVIVVLIVVALVIKFWGNVDEDRRIAITKDIQNIKGAVLLQSNKHISDESMGELPGKSLEEKGVQININGIVEEYRYGYYLLEPKDLKLLDVSLNLPEERYLVNYETGDVINATGIKYNKRVYHSIDDLTAIQTGEVPLSDKVIIISKAEHLDKIRNNPNGYFRLSANIDLSSYAQGDGWNPIKEFSGIFDGRGYTISNLTINRATQDYIGLFGDVKSSAKITNLKIEDAKIIGGRYTGVLAGNCTGSISYVHVSGTVTGLGGSTGGLVGAFSTSQIRNCTIKGDVKGDSAVGGAIGTLYGGTLNRVRTEGNVTAIENVGGLVGLARITISTYVQESAAYEHVNGKSNLGGLIGSIEMTGTIQTDDENVSDDLNISNTYAIGSVQTGEKNMGGMIGQIYTVQGAPSIVFKHLYSDVSVVVKGETSGGFLGQSDASNTSCSVIECYWKKDIAPGEVLNGVGQTVQGNRMNFEDRTPEAMIMRSNYDWNFDSVWEIKDRRSTPTLKWERDYIAGGK